MQLQILTRADTMLKQYLRAILYQLSLKDIEFMWYLKAVLYKFCMNRYGAAKHLKDMEQVGLNVNHVDISHRTEPDHSIIINNEINYLWSPTHNTNLVNHLWVPIAIGHITWSSKDIISDTPPKQNLKIERMKKCKKLTEVIVAYNAERDT